MSAQRIRSQQGFTMLEVMIAMTIGLMLAFGLVRVFASSNEAYQTVAQASQQIENGRYAMQVVSDDLRHAGYYGEYAFAPAAGTTLPDPCEIADLVAMKGALSFYIQGYGNVAAGSSPIACLDSANIQPNTDILVVRRVHTSTTAIGSLSANEVYVQANSDPSDTANPIMALGSTPASFTLTKKDAVTLAEIRKYHVHIYFVSPCSVPASGTTCTAAADGGRPIPTLKRLIVAIDSTGTLTIQTEALAEGIENLQIDYGIDTDSDGLPDGNFLAAPAAVADWSNVMAAQVYVLARTPEIVAGLVDAKTYNMGTTSVTPGLSYRRHLFTERVRIVNPAGHREVP